MQPEEQQQSLSELGQVKSTPVDSIAEYVNVVKAFRDQWRPTDSPPMTWHPWFRGQPKAGWPLIPGIFRTSRKRGSVGVNDALCEELSLRQEFERRGRQLTPDQPQNSWEWYFLMQHYGVPTRLLDWTDGALIALYFAVRHRTAQEGADQADAAVWVIDPWHLNAQNESLSLQETKTADAVLLPSQVPPRYFPETAKHLEDMSGQPVAVHPPHMARRLAVQRSHFILFGADPMGIETSMVRSGRLQKLIIKQRLLRGMFLDLQTCGISQSTLFPDLEGLGSELKRAWSTAAFWR